MPQMIAATVVTGLLGAGRTGLPAGGPGGGCFRDRQPLPW